MSMWSARDLKSDNNQWTSFSCFSEKLLPFVQFSKKAVNFGVISGHPITSVNAELSFSKLNLKNSLRKPCSKKIEKINTSCHRAYFNEYFSYNNGICIKMKIHIKFGEFISLVQSLCRFSITTYPSDGAAW